MVAGFWPPVIRIDFYMHIGNSDVCHIQGNENKSCNLVTCNSVYHNSNDSKTGRWKAFMSKMLLAVAGELERKNKLEGKAAAEKRRTRRFSNDSLILLPRNLLPRSTTTGRRQEVEKEEKLSVFEGRAPRYFLPMHSSEPHSRFPKLRCKISRPLPAIHLSFKISEK